MTREESSIGHPFGDGLGLQEEQQIIAPAGLRVCSGHIETAEGVSADHGAGALAIEVEIADVERVGGLFELFRVARIDRASEAELGVIGDLERVVKIFRRNHGENGAE